MTFLEQYEKMVGAIRNVNRLKRMAESLAGKRSFMSIRHAPAGAWRKFSAGWCR